jgi:hypothetical protein
VIRKEEQVVNWHEKIDVSEEFQQAKDGKITIPELAQCVADKLDSLYGRDLVLSGIIRDLRSMNDKTEVDDFDKLWNHLYNWADYENRLWIKTF